jgi:hypothetical protein
MGSKWAVSFLVCHVLKFPAVSCLVDLLPFLIGVVKRTRLKVRLMRRSEC